MCAVSANIPKKCGCEREMRMHIGFSLYFKALVGICLAAG